MLKILLARNFTYLHSVGFAAEQHQHIAPQLSLARSGCTITNGDLRGPGLYIPGDVSHAVASSSTFYTFLINPVYGKARRLSGKEDSARSFEPASDLADKLESLTFKPDDAPVLQATLDQMLTALGTPNAQSEPLDIRILETVRYIDDLEQKRVAAGQLAEQIALSESRFLHLFKDELNIPVRKYLLWKRTMDGARLVVEKSSITEAAHAAGFTDSAHFARVFKQMFGMTLSSAFGRKPTPVLVLAND